MIGIYFVILIGYTLSLSVPDNGIKFAHYNNCFSWFLVAVPINNYSLNSLKSR